MPSDAKLGLVVGLILVLLVALLFFRRDGAGQVPAAAPAPRRTTPQPPKLPPPPRIEALPKVAPPPVEVEELPEPAFKGP